MMENVTRVALKLFATTKSTIFLARSQMTISSPTPSEDTSVWTSLKQAISASSGFQHWTSQLPALERRDLNLDALVQRYLRETLETLAY
jgi:hypothetical protein